MEAGTDGSGSRQSVAAIHHDTYTLYKKSVAYALTFQSGNVSWARVEAGERKGKGERKLRANKCERCLPIRRVLVAEVDSDSGGSNKSHKNENATGHLTIHFIEHLAKQKLKVAKITFGGQLSVCRKCAEIIQGLISHYEPHRPKNLLVFINPQSGNKSGETTYRRKVAPLFSLCGIQTKEIVTQRVNHSKEELLTADLSHTDGIICVGGDGTLSEVANGYLQRCNKDAHINFNDPDSVLPRPRIPIGVIPTGSGDTIVRFVHETRSVSTAAIHIVLGKTRGLDFGSVHHGHQLLSYTCLLVGYGLYGRLIEAIEARRWLPGKIRYSVIPLLELLKVRSFQVQVEMLMPIGGEKIPLDMAVDRESDFDEAVSLSAKQPARLVWREYKGPLLGVDSFIVQLMPVGTSMRPYIGNGLAQLTLVKNCSRIHHLRHLVKLMDRSPGFYDYDFIEEHWVKGYRVKALAAHEDRGIPEMYLMNCDGDLTRLEEPHFEIRVHKELIKLFTWADADWPEWVCTETEDI